ncbi:ATP-binding protein [Litorimonas sp. RW-G-Af-16]|uniref:ATP-binding protein n=1 Tax=Litorimonas sp. RW-G-Af-16 TaxID=3241168 RepID=UPI003AAD0E08
MIRAIKSKKRLLIRTVSATILALALPYVSFAQDQSATRNAAIALAERIETQNLIKVDDNLLLKPVATMTAAQKVETSRTLLYEVIFTENMSEIDALLESHKIAVETFGDPSDLKALELFESFLIHYESGLAADNYDAIISDISPYFTDDDWFVAFQAFALKSQLEADLIQRMTAMESAQEALKLIPNDLSDHAKEARIRITDIIVYLHNLQHNTDLAIENSDHLINLKLEAGQTVDGIELLNNLMYSLGIWRDHETSLAIAETLKRLEQQSSSTTAGLTQMRLSQAYAENGDFSDAEKNALEAIEKGQIEAIVTRAKIQLAISYAGQGKPEDARKTLASIGEVSEHDRTYYLYAEALIAIAEGQPLEGVKLLNRRLDESVQTILAANSRDTTALLASLENTRERQQEREKALIRENQLKAQKILVQQRVNRLLMVLLGLLGAALIAALFFARYRDKVSKELAIKTKEAESADRMKTEFLGMISHELRTPLNGIIGIADFLTHRHKDPDVRQKSGIILESGNILFGLLEAIIDMARIDGNKLHLYPEPTALAPLLKDVAYAWEDEARAKGITYTHFISDDLNITAECDGKRLQQCLNSLLSNAIKFTDGGRVHLHVTEETSPDGEVYLQAIVADTGMGIRPEVQAKLFKPFLQADSSMTRKHNGSGLSLAIVRSLARMMNGDITLVSTAGRGSEFKLTARLPHVDPVAPAQTTPAVDVTVTPDQISSETQDDNVLDLMVPMTNQDVPSLHQSVPSDAAPCDAWLR